MGALNSEEEAAKTERRKAARKRKRLREAREVIRVVLTQNNCDKLKIVIFAEVLL